MDPGGTIGTGLFIGSGQALSKSGPAGALVGYALVGTIVYSVMQSLGEMATYIPISGAFTAYATRFVDPSFGFAMGWIYWFSWAMTHSLELTATGDRVDLSVLELQPLYRDLHWGFLGPHHRRQLPACQFLWRI